ncbi:MULTISPECIES: hypothetical protein [unclassified Gemella]|uniref:hypothetical protein n=1 Tax=unclassified Gemella TaxID=2624949 RepID=UPI001C05D505|nr:MULTISPECIES: hypothetical protein [unclassified Gemella]MBU0278100.1 hypothetical protein [Gemella sp. zg-1178]QWQ38373.1 hypothetical protein KMP11_05285 [Gemella sp. zg-570]
MMIEQILNTYYADYENKPFISSDRDFDTWFKEVSVSKSKLVPKRNMQFTKENLLAGDIILLWRINFGTFTTESIKTGYYPKYFEYSYGIDAPSNLKKLLEDGYVLINTLLNSLEHNKMDNLKVALKSKNIKGISKLNKKELHSLIKNNFSEEELEQFISVRLYSLTDKGILALKNNQEIVDRHPKKKF